jgi:hypothetical protein
MSVRELEVEVEHRYAHHGYMRELSVIPSSTVS